MYAAGPQQLAHHNTGIYRDPVLTSSSPSLLNPPPPSQSQRLSTTPHHMQQGGMYPQPSLVGAVPSAGAPLVPPSAAADRLSATSSSSATMPPPAAGGVPAIGSRAASRTVTPSQSVHSSTTPPVVGGVGSAASASRMMPPPGARTPTTPGGSLGVEPPQRQPQQQRDTAATFGGGRTPPPPQPVQYVPWASVLDDGDHSETTRGGPRTPPAMPQQQQQPKPQQLMGCATPPHFEELPLVSELGSSHRATPLPQSVDEVNDEPAVAAGGMGADGGAATMGQRSPRPMTPSLSQRASPEPQRVASPALQPAIVQRSSHMTPQEADHLIAPKQQAPTAYRSTTTGATSRVTATPAANGNSLMTSLSKATISSATKQHGTATKQNAKVSRGEQQPTAQDKSGTTANPPPALPLAVVDRRRAAQYKEQLHASSQQLLLINRGLLEITEAHRMLRQESAVLRGQLREAEGAKSEAEQQLQALQAELQEGLSALQAQLRERQNKLAELRLEHRRLHEQQRPSS